MNNCVTFGEYGTRYYTALSGTMQVEIPNEKISNRLFKWQEY